MLNGLRTLDFVGPQHHLLFISIFKSVVLCLQYTLCKFTVQEEEPKVGRGN